MTIARLRFTALWRLAFVFLSTPAVAIAAEPVEISASLGQVQVGRHLEFAEDKRGTLTLADGREVKGFICEGWAAETARDVTEFGGWRAYIADQKAKAND